MFGGIFLMLISNLRYLEDVSEVSSIIRGGNCSITTTTINGKTTVTKKGNCKVTVKNSKSGVSVSTTNRLTLKDKQAAKVAIQAANALVSDLDKMLENLF